MRPVSDLFDVTYGHSLELNRLKPLSKAEGGVAFVSRKMGDNGIASYVEPIPGVVPSPAGLLTCALSGNGVLSTFLQDEPFYSGYHIAILRPKAQMSKEQLLFYCYCIAANRYRYNYGRQANRTLKQILIPDITEFPAYVQNVDVTQYVGCNVPASVNAPIPLRPQDWQFFRLGDLFDIRKGQRLTKANMRRGGIPYIGASDSANGVTAFIGQSPIHDGGTISVSYNGSVAEAFYQPVPYWATDDVNVLYPRGFALNAEQALFICAIIRLEKYRFNYGRKWHLERMREAVIKLPVNAIQTPDWAFMERYIRTLSFSSQIS